MSKLTNKASSADEAFIRRNDGTKAKSRCII